jgi:hypothetical protein
VGLGGRRLLVTVLLSCAGARAEAYGVLSHLAIVDAA